MAKRGEWNGRSRWRGLILAGVLGLMLGGLSLGGCDSEDNDWTGQEPDLRADLVLSKTVAAEGGAALHEGGLIRYEISVRNQGRAVAEGVVIVDSLPDAVVLVGAEFARGDFETATGLWTLGDLAPDSSAMLALTVLVNEGTAGEVVANEAFVLEIQSDDSEPADNQAAVSFTVAEGPDYAVRDQYTLAEGETLTVAAPGLLGNDGADGVTLAVDPVPVAPPLHGSLVLLADGSFAYAHDGGEAPADSFAYVAFDAVGTRDTGWVTLTVTPVNDLPVGTPDEYEVAEGAELAGNVLDNDWDAEEDPLVATLLSQPTHAAQFEFAADGAFTYLHDGGESALDGFFYELDDGTDTTERIRVTIDILAANDPPQVAGIPDQAVDEGGAFAAVPLDDYASDPDHEDGEFVWSVAGAGALAVSIDPATHVATISAEDPDWFGSEVLVFRATDPAGGWGEDQATFVVRPVNDPPLIDPIEDQVIDEGGTFRPLDLDEYVSDVDDPDADLVWWFTGADQLTVELGEDHVVQVTQPHEDWYGSETIRFHVSDPGALVAVVDVDFVVNSVNDRPIVSPLPNQTVSQGSPFLPILLDSYVHDVDNADDELTWIHLDGEPLVVVISPDRVATVTPPTPGWVGTAEVVFRAIDPGGLWDQRSAFFTVEAAGP